MVISGQEYFNYIPYHVPSEKYPVWKSLPEDAQLSGFLGVVVNPAACQAFHSDWEIFRVRFNSHHIVYFENLFTVCWTSDYITGASLARLIWLNDPLGPPAINRQHVFFYTVYANDREAWIMLLAHSVSHTHLHTPFHAETHLKPLLRVLLQQGAVEVN